MQLGGVFCLVCLLEGVFTFKCVWGSYIVETICVCFNNFNKEDFKNLNNLNFLNISRSDLTEDCIYFNNSKNLQQLIVDHINVFSGKCLLNLSNLEKLSAVETQLKEEYLINLKKLKKLNISYCKNINGKGLQNMTNLESLDAIDTLLEDKYLKSLNSLTSLNLNNCKTISGECLQNLTHLKTLAINETTNITDIYLKNLQQLTNLSINDCKRITGECLLSLTSLQNLSIERTNICDKYLLNLQQLSYLTIDGCKHIYGKCLLYLTNLTQLIINYTDYIKEEYLEQLTKLQILYAQNCYNIKNGQFLLKLKNLNTLVCTNSILENQEIEEIRERIRKGETVENLFKPNSVELKLLNMLSH
ncbi:hypothetical protein ABK040_004086 [Willaertia magna]